MEGGKNRERKEGKKERRERGIKVVVLFQKYVYDTRL